MVKLKKLVLFILSALLILPLLTGCWNKEEINDRAFINTIYIDKNYTDRQSNIISTDLKKRDQEDLFVTFGIISSAEGQDELKAYNYSVTGVSLSNAVEKITSEIAKTPFFGHTKLIIFGKGVIQDKILFREILDDIERNTAIDREVKVIVADSTSVTLDKIRPESEKLYSSYITGVMDDHHTISYTVSMNMGKFLQELRENEGYTTIPIISVLDKKIKIDKLGIIRDYSLDTICEARDVRGYKLFMGKSDNIREYIKIDNVLATFKVFNTKRKIKFDGSGNVPKFKLTYTVEGGIDNYEFGKMVFTEKQREKLKQNIEKITYQQLEETVSFFQKQIKYDYLGLGDYVEKYHPYKFKEYKDWHEEFKKAEIDFEVDVDIIRFGDSK